MKALGWMAAAVVLVIIVSGGGGDDDKSPATGDAPTVSSADGQARPKTAYGRVKARLRDEFSGDVKEVGRPGDALLVGLKGDENLTGGMTRTGLRLDAQKVFEIVHSAGLHPRATTVQFHMPLTDTATGRESDNIVAVYSLPRAAARQIDWANSDAIDWDTYRTMLHPALQ